jgi:penicillin amidase
VTDGRATPAPIPAPARRPRRRALRLVAWTLTGLLGLLLIADVVAAVWGWRTVRGSLPAESGRVRVADLGAEVTVTRDGAGVPTIRGRTRRDVARATGFVHAQERYFQMDLQRRQAAGELAALVGAAALPLDRASRLHRFRARAARVVDAASPDERALLEAYTAGVNAGLAALRAAPFEYALLRTAPQPWRLEDGVLVQLSMFIELQDGRGLQERRLALMADRLPGPLVEFLVSPGSDWDTSIDGTTLAPPAIPGPEIVNLRARVPAAAAEASPALTGPATNGLDDSDLRPGSNNWVVAGAHTASRAALLASDMHLGHSVPNIWYRAVLEWGDGGPEGPTRLVGVTLPGVPALVAGSNGHIAWGFTNTEGDWSDLVLVEPDPADASRYLTPEGPRAFAVHNERLAVARGDDEILPVRETIWGPVAGEAPGGRALALRWVAHDVEGVNLRLFGMERARTVDDALRTAPQAGVPAQNCVIATATGDIAWTIAGRIPRRAGFDGRVPVSWADGTRGWRGWLAPAEYPRVVNPPSGRIVTANNRIVGGEALRVIGQGAYDQGARARQIRDGLAAIAHATPADMLRIQLDDRALFLERWRDLALRVLDPAATAADPARRGFRDLVEGGWNGRASADSVAYRMVKAFRTRVAELAFAPLIAPVLAADSTFPATLGRAHEGALWQLVSHRPLHLLDPKYASWEALFLTAVDRCILTLTEGGRPLAQRTWGEVNTVAVRHPLSRAVPWLSAWLDMPARPMPGDAHMPRVQATAFGASERLVVSPGREQDGLFHMPAGQSGHPWSPAYRAGHDAWVEGRATPLMPGPAASAVTLTPP